MNFRFFFASRHKEVISLIEMQRKTNRLFTNELPKWALIVHKVMIFLLFLVAVPLCVLSLIALFTEDDLSIFLFLGIIGGGVFWFGRFCYKNLLQYTQQRLIVELREDGYFTSFSNQKTNEKQTIFLPFAGMKYVLLGMDYQYAVKATPRSTGPGGKVVFYRVVKLMISGISSDRKHEVVSFPIGDQPTLDEWVNVFQANQVPVLVTDKALSAVPYTKEGIDAVPKAPYQGTLPFRIGSEAKELDNVFLTEEQQKQQAEKKKKNRKRMRGFLIGLGILQMLMVRYWFIDWRVVDESVFSDKADDTLVLFLTLIGLLVIRFFTQSSRWFDPLVDMLVLFGGLTVGLLWTLVSVSVPDGFSFAVYSHWLLNCFLYAPFAIFMIVRQLLRDRKEKKQQREQAV